MNRNSIIAIIAVVVVIGAFWYALKPWPAAAPVQTSVANPASTNCVQTLGGTLEIADSAQGAVGYCHLPDGRVCEEWSLFRNEGCVPPPATPSAAAGATVPEGQSTSSTIPEAVQ